ncbi:MAG: Fmu (Sun) domain-containing protein, partial [Chitinophagaceae bacterium]
MSRFHSYINSSKRIVDGYDAEHPFPIHLKKQFSANKQIGSRDRKMIAEICYAWFRTSHLFNRNLQDQNIVNAIFLCAQNEHPLLAALAPELNELVALPVPEKFAHLNLNPANLFPFKDALGAIESEPFFLSFLSQPLLFLRMRPGMEKVVIEKLKDHQSSFTQIGFACVALPNATKLEEVIALNKEAVVQDYSSQQVFNFLEQTNLDQGNKIVWDCCAASGGKSILVHDKLSGKIHLTVSDIRGTIMHNCKQRLQEAGVPIEHSFVTDVASELSQKLPADFSIIICDVPCTGSGTWSRTPEQLA